MTTLAIVILAMFAGAAVTALIALCVYLVWETRRLHGDVARISAEFPELLTAAHAEFTAMRDSLAKQIACLHGDEWTEASRQAIAAAVRMERAAIGFADVVKAMYTDTGMADAVAGAENGGEGTGVDGGVETDEEAPAAGGLDADIADIVRQMRTGRGSRGSGIRNGIGSGLPPNAYAPPAEGGQSYVGQSRVAVGDAEDEILNGGTGVRGMEAGDVGDDGD